MTTDNAELLRRINEASRSTVDGPKGYRASAMYLLKRLHEAQAVLTDCRAVLSSPVASAQDAIGQNAMTILAAIRDAKRYDKTVFANDTEFVDWAQSMARHATQVFPLSAASLAERNANG